MSAFTSLQRDKVDGKSESDQTSKEENWPSTCVHPSPSLNPTFLAPPKGRPPRRDTNRLKRHIGPRERY